MQNQDIEKQPLTGKDEKRTIIDGEFEPTKFFCGTCQKDQISKPEYKTGTWTYLLCVILCFFSCIGGIIPFFCDKCKDTVQYCPECHNKVGEKQFKPI